MADWILTATIIGVPEVYGRYVAIARSGDVGREVTWIGRWLRGLLFLVFYSTAAGILASAMYLLSPPMTPGWILLLWVAQTLGTGGFALAVLALDRRSRGVRSSLRPLSVAGAIFLIPVAVYAPLSPASLLPALLGAPLLSGRFVVVAAGYLLLAFAGSQLARKCVRLVHQLIAGRPGEHLRATAA